MEFVDEVTSQGRSAVVRNFLKSHKDLDHRIKFLEACLEELMCRSCNINQQCDEAEQLRNRRVELRIRKMEEDQSDEVNDETIEKIVEQAYQAYGKTMERLMGANDQIDNEMAPSRSN
jgi:hypothetical protein